MMVTLGLLPTLQAQTFTDKLTNEFTFEKKSSYNTLMVANINGSVTITGYTGDKVLVEAERIITAKTDSRLEKGKRELKLGVLDRADTIILYVDGICNHFGRKSDGWKKNYNGWGYTWEDCHDQGDWRRDEGYDFKINFTIKVPAGINVMVSTVNDGDLAVSQVSGRVVADNVNGNIRLRDLASAVRAHAINGDVDLDFVQNPQQDCRVYSLNGDINALFRKGLAATMSFESFNGNFYTNVASLTSLPSVLEKKEAGTGVKYKVNGNRYQIGKGGAYLDFETFNGDVFLKEKEN